MNFQELRHLKTVTKDKKFMAKIKQGISAGKEAFMIRILTVHVCNRYKLLLEKMLDLEVINFNFGEGEEGVEEELSSLKKLINDYGLKDEVEKVRLKHET